jgi:hypothetical protein
MSTTFFAIFCEFLQNFKGNSKHCSVLKWQFIVPKLAIICLDRETQKLALKSSFWRQPDKLKFENIFPFSDLCSIMAPSTERKMDL